MIVIQFTSEKALSFYPEHGHLVELEGAKTVDTLTEANEKLFATHVEIKLRRLLKKEAILRIQEG